MPFLEIHGHLIYYCIIILKGKICIHNITVWCIDERKVKTRRKKSYRNVKLGINVEKCGIVSSTSSRRKCDKRKMADTMSLLWHNTDATNCRFMIKIINNFHFFSISWKNKQVSRSWIYGGQNPTDPTDLLHTIIFETVSFSSNYYCISGRRILRRICRVCCKEIRQKKLLH